MNCPECGKDDCTRSSCRVLSEYRCDIPDPRDAEIARLTKDRDDYRAICLRQHTATVAAKDWEDRAEAAEAREARLRAALEEAVKLYDPGTPWSRNAFSEIGKDPIAEEIVAGWRAALAPDVVRKTVP